MCGMWDEEEEYIRRGEEGEKRRMGEQNYWRKVEGGRSGGGI